MTYNIKKSKAKEEQEYVRIKHTFGLSKLKPIKGKYYAPDYSTAMPVERDAIGRIIIYNKEGKEIKRKPTDFVELEGKRYPIE